MCLGEYPSLTDLTRMVATRQSITRHADICGAALWTMMKDTALSRRFLCLVFDQENGRFITNATEATTIELATDLTASCSVSSSMALLDVCTQSLNLQVGATASGATNAIDKEQFLWG
jgi:hypothetical protein